MMLLEQFSHVVVKELANFCMVGRGWNSSLLGHMNYSLPLDKTLSAIHFQLCRVWNSVSCIGLDIERADLFDVKQLRFFRWKFWSMFFLSSQKEKITKQASWCARNLLDLVWNTVVWIILSLPSFFLEVRIVNTLPKGQESARFVAVLMDEVLECLEDRGSP